METGLAPGQPVFGRDDEGQVVGVDDPGGQPVVLGGVADDPQLEVPVDQLGGDAARQAPADLHPHARVAAAVLGEVGQQVEGGRLVGPDGEPAAGVVPPLGHRGQQLLPQVLEAAGEVEHQVPASVRRTSRPSAVDEPLAQLLLQALHGQGDGGLAAGQAGGRPGEALLGGHRPEHL